MDKYVNLSFEELVKIKNNIDEILHKKIYGKQLIFSFKPISEILISKEKIKEILKNNYYFDDEILVGYITTKRLKKEVVLEQNKKYKHEWFLIERNNSGSIIINSSVTYLTREDLHNYLISFL